MKYETPEVTVLTPAINAIQAAKGNPDQDPNDDAAVYEDWE